MDLFEREDLKRLIRLLAERLDSAGVKGTVSIVGGAAIALQYLQDRDATTDIDAVLPQSDLVARVIAEIAVEENLDPKWVNEAVTAYVPFETSEMWTELLSVGGIHIRIASSDLLLAMKLKADRGRRDRGDIEGLIKLGGYTQLRQVQEIYERFHHQEVLAAGTSLMVEEILSKL